MKIRFWSRWPEERMKINFTWALDNVNLNIKMGEMSMKKQNYSMSTYNNKVCVFCAYHSCNVDLIVLKGIDWKLCWSERFHADGHISQDHWSAQIEHNSNKVINKVLHTKDIIKASSFICIIIYIYIISPNVFTQKLQGQETDYLFNF